MNRAFPLFYLLTLLSSCVFMTTWECGWRLQKLMEWDWILKFFFFSCQYKLPAALMYFKINILFSLPRMGGSCVFKASPMIWIWHLKIVFIFSALLLELLAGGHVWCCDADYSKRFCLISYCLSDLIYIFLSLNYLKCENCICFKFYAVHETWSWTVGLLYIMLMCAHKDYSPYEQQVWSLYFVVFLIPGLARWLRSTSSDWVCQSSKELQLKQMVWLKK